MVSEPFDKQKKKLWAVRRYRRNLQRQGCREKPVESQQLALGPNHTNHHLFISRFPLLEFCDVPKLLESDDPEQSVIINETAAKTFGWENPIGKKIQELDGRHIIKTVIGVIKDYHIVFVRQAIEPLLISDSPEGYEVLVIKIVPGSTAKTLEALKKKWKEIAPSTPFEFNFLGDRFNSQYDSEERLSQIFSYFSLLAIFIAVWVFSVWRHIQSSRGPRRSAYGKF